MSPVVKVVFTLIVVACVVLQLYQQPLYKNLKFDHGMLSAQ